MKIIFVFTVFSGLVAASRNFNFEELSNLHAKVPKTKLSMIEKIQQAIDNQQAKAPCKRFNYKNRSTRNCGNRSSNQNTAPTLTANQKARLARYLNLMNSNMRF